MPVICPSIITEPWHIFLLICPPSVQHTCLPTPWLTRLFLTSITAGTVGRPGIYTCGTCVVTQVTLSTWLVLALGTRLHTTAFITNSAAKIKLIETRKINIFKWCLCKWAELIYIPACAIWHIYTSVTEWVNKGRGERGVGMEVKIVDKSEDFR